MFDANIQLYAYNNTEGDDFGVGYLGNKEFWVGLVNRWNKEDGKKARYTAETFDSIDADDFRGCVLAEVEPDHEGYVVTWYSGDTEYIIDIKGSEFVWEQNDSGSVSVPQWVRRLKNQLREQDN